MNWAKVKNILIVIFLILNGALGYMNYQKRVEAFTLNSQQESNIKKLLYENNIMIYTFLPQKYLPMKKLILSPKETNGEEEMKILKAIFEDTEGISISIETTEQNKKQTTYSKNGKKVGFSTGRIIYRNNFSSSKRLINTTSEAKDTADKFLKQLGYNISKFMCDFKDEGNGQYRYTYYEIYQGHIIYNNRTEILVNSTGIESADIYRMRPIKYIEIERSIYASDEILFGFMNQIKKLQEAEDILVIQKIDLGYKVASEEMQGKEVEAIPYYRITLSDGRHYYINAYTNQIEE